MKVLPALVFTAALVSCSGNEPKEPSHEWPRWRGPNGDGTSAETDWNPKALAAPHVLWQASVGQGYSDVAVTRNHLFTAGLKDGKTVVSCLSADRGRVLWEYTLDTSYNAPQGTPATDGKSVYMLTGNGVLLCLDAAAGHERWKKDLVSDYGAVRPFYNFAGSPVLEGDLVLLTANTSGMALKKETGELAWTSMKPPRQSYGLNSTGVEYATPVICSLGGKRYAIICSYEGVHGVDPKTGRVGWLYSWPGDYDSVVADPLLVGGRVLVTRYHDGFGTDSLDVSGSAPRRLWSSPGTCSQIGSAVFLDGYVYAPCGGPDSHKASLRCWDPADGRVLWEEKIESKGMEPALCLSAAGGKLLVISGYGTLAVAEPSPKAYAEVSRVSLKGLGKAGGRFWTPPVLCNGRLYCRAFGGELTCIDMR